MSRASLFGTLCSDRSSAVLPLLLDGYEFFVINEHQYDDVSDGRMPSPRLTKRRAQLTSTAEPVAARPTITDLMDEDSRLVGLERWEDALAAYDRAIELDANHTNVHYNRGSHSPTWFVGRMR